MFTPSNIYPNRLFQKLGNFENIDGTITVCDGNISLSGCELADLVYGNYASNSNGTIIKK